MVTVRQWCTRGSRFESHTDFAKVREDCTLMRGSTAASHDHIVKKKITVNGGVAELEATETE